MNRIKNHLLEVLEGSSIHCTIENALKDIPYAKWGKEIKEVPYTLYELLEHIRLSNLDILEYITNPDYLDFAKKMSEIQV